MNKLFFLLGFIGLFTIANSCTDKCKDVNCNNGICVDGNCSCDFGWMGENCNIKESSVFFGEWKGVLSCVNDTVIFQIDDVANELQKLKMHTKGLSFNFGNFPINFDSYVFDGNIDSTFSRFDLDTLNVSLTIPNFGDINVELSGDGEFKEDSLLGLNLNILAKSLNYTIVCKGDFDK
ncbi:MAG TPA: hypothetical protein ENK91_13880 [Bacteroidetes bacterium]|nr:hypothetical protein [Bacteroidota bacterium]